MKDLVNEKIREFFRTEFNLAHEESFFSLTDGAGIPIDYDEFLSDKPEEGVSISNVQESFADLVNVMPVYSDDLTVVGADELYSIDQVYYQILLGSKPRVAGMDQAKAEELTGLFNQKKDAAIKKYADAGRVSQKAWDFTNAYQMTEAEPESWYKNESSLWKSHSMEVKLAQEDKASLGTQVSLSSFKQQVNDASIINLQNQKQIATKNKGVAFATVGAIKKVTNTVSPLKKQVDKLKTNITGEVKVHDHRTQTGGANAVPAPRRRAGFIWVNNHWEREKNANDKSNKDFQILGNLASKYTPLGDKRNIISAINSIAGQTSINAKSITANFEYLLVSIDRRRWFDSTFLNDTNWYHPGKAKGSFTLSPDSNGLDPTLYAVPMAIVLIKNLTITSDTWSESDKASFSTSISLSGFNTQNARMEGNVISAPEIQAMGWISRKLSALPPNDPD